LPLRETFRTALGEKKITKNVGVVVDLGDIQGFGEASSSLAMPEASQASMIHTIQQSSAFLIGAPLEDWEDLSKEITQRNPGQPTAVSSIECALLDVFCRIKKKSIAHFFGGRKKEIETYYTLAALAPALCASIARKLFVDGFRKFKVKVTGQDFEQDFKRVQAVFKAGKKISLIIDANQGFNRQSALYFIDRLQAESLSVDLIEQPLPKDDLKGMKFVKDRSPFPIAADESVSTLENAQSILDAGAADVFNLKLAKSGLLESVKIAELAGKAGIKLMIGCMMESASGLSASVQWALGSGCFDFHDLDSFLLLNAPSGNTGFKNRGAVLRLKPKTFGSGVYDL